jgi:glutathione peroxidase
MRDRRPSSSSLVVLVAALASCTPQARKDEARPIVSTSAASAAPPSPTTAMTTKTIYDFTLDTIDGTPRSLGEYRGKVLLLVNTASECGYTPQYEGLQKLHAAYEKRGFSVIGFPSNDFGGQEPGSNEEIKTFCSTKFGVTFPLFAKITVKGPSKHPLYAMLTETPPAGEVKWNFGKFLVGKDGHVIARYDSGTTPSAATLVEAIEKALGS